MSKQTIKVLHMLGKRPVGGVGTFLKNVHSHLNTEKIQFDYIIGATEPDGEFDQYVKKLGGSIYVLPELGIGNAISYIKELKMFFEKYGSTYDIIHIHTPNIATFGLFFAKRNGINIRIIHSHSARYSDTRLKSFRNFILALPIKKLANKYIACSEDSAEFLFKKQNCIGNVSIIRNAVRLEDYKFSNDSRIQIRERLKIDDYFVIGHVGSFLPVKNHDFIIDIFYEAYKLDNRLLLLLVGTGELESKIRDKVNNLDLEKNVLFLGRRQDVNRLMHAIDLFILPSVFEGLPLVGIEAQVSGLPCIFADTITRELQILKQVSFLSVRSRQDWVKAILEHKSNRVSASEREEGYYNMNFSEFDIKSQTLKLEKLYKNPN